MLGSVLDNNTEFNFHNTPLSRSTCTALTTVITLYSQSQLGTIDLGNIFYSTNTLNNFSILLLTQFLYRHSSR